jgi:hypothetical protein
MATLADYVESEKQRYEEMLARAAAAAAQAQAAIPIARADLDALTGQRTTLQDEVTQLRAQLATGPPAADAEQLGLDLEEKLQELHGKDLEIADKRAELGGLVAGATAYAEQAGRAQAAAKEVEARSDEADALKRELDALSDAMGDPRIGNVMADAAAAAPKEAAARKKLAGDQNVAGDLPATLFDRAEARWQLEHDRVKDADDLVARIEKSAANIEGPVAEAGLDHERARAKLRQYVGTARERLDAAIAVLDGVAAAPALSADTRDRLAGKPAADVNVKKFFDDAVAAAGKENTRDDKLDELYAARRAVDDARVTAIRSNPDRLIDGAAQVTNAQTDVGTALTAVKQNDYTAVSDALNAWEAAVPETTWSLFAGYERARQTLVDLAEDPTPFAPDVVAKEDAYVSQLQSEGKRKRKQWTLEAFAQARAGGAAAVHSSEDERLKAAVRGDAWEQAVDRP